MSIKDNLRRVEYKTKYKTINIVWAEIRKTEEYLIIKIPGNGEIPIKLDKVINKTELL